MSHLRRLEFNAGLHCETAAMSPVKAPANLPELVRSAFQRAKTAGDLNYYATQVTILSPSSVPFQLRFSPALANKPTAPRPKPSSPQKPFDPFESPENGPLFVAEIIPSHNLVLNKFAIVPEHFILATKDFREQTHLLEEGDLAATYACIEAYHEAEEAGGSSGELFAFFNSGPHSGASQPHRHVQLLPVARMKEGLADGSSWDVLADKLLDAQVDGGQAGPTTTARNLPFATFASRIGPATPSAADLHATYTVLYRQAVEAVRKHLDPAGLAKESDETLPPTSAAGDPQAEISYNMAMTRSTLVICPRLAEGATLSSSEGDLVGKLSLNGTVLAGTALVKSEQEWDALRAEAAKDGERQQAAETLAGVLEKIGVPTNIAFSTPTTGATCLVSGSSGISGSSGGGGGGGGRL